jgi:hypothetical protein
MFHWMSANCRMATLMLISASSATAHAQQTATTKRGGTTPASVTSNSEAVTGSANGSVTAIRPDATEQGQ